MNNKIFKQALFVGVATFAILTQIECGKLYNENESLQSELGRHKIHNMSLRSLIDNKELEINGLKYSLEVANKNISSLEADLTLLDMYIKEEENSKLRAVNNFVSFDASDLRVLSNVTEEQLSYALKGTKLQHLAGSYVELEKNYGWNALAAAALTAHESFWGQDYKATELCNIAGVRLRDGSYRSFSSQDECIDYVGSLLSRLYLNPDGAYFNGDYSLLAVNENYCPAGGTKWSDSISSIATDLMNKINNRGEN